MGWSEEYIMAILGRWKSWLNPVFFACFWLGSPPDSPRFPRYLSLLCGFMLFVDCRDCQLPSLHSASPWQLHPTQLPLRSFAPSASASVHLGIPDSNEWELLVRLESESHVVKNTSFCRLQVLFLQVSNQFPVVCRTQKVVPVRVMASFKASTVLSESAVEPPRYGPILWDSGLKCRHAKGMLIAPKSAHTRAWLEMLCPCLVNVSVWCQRWCKSLLIWDIWDEFKRTAALMILYRHLEAFLQPARIRPPVSASESLSWPIVYVQPLQLASKYRMHPTCTGVSPMFPHWKGQQCQQTLENGLQGTLTRRNVKNMTCKWQSRYACEEWCTRTLGICKQVGLKICKGPTIQSPPHPVCASGNQESLTASDGSLYRFQWFHRFYWRYL